MADKDNDMMRRLDSRQISLEQFGKNIRFLREEEGLTLEEVAGALGYKTPSVVAKWETGMTRPPIESIAKIGLMFGVSTDFLLTESVEKGNRKAIHTVPLAPDYIYDLNGSSVKCCPCCGKPLDANGNDGRFCKYCGQEIEGKEEYGKNIRSLKRNATQEKKTSEFKWGWY